MHFALNTGRVPSRVDLLLRLVPSSGRPLQTTLAVAADPDGRRGHVDRSDRIRSWFLPFEQFDPANARIEPEARGAGRARSRAGAGAGLTLRGAARNASGRGADDPNSLVRNHCRGRRESAAGTAGRSRYEPRRRQEEATKERRAEAAGTDSSTARSYGASPSSARLRCGSRLELAADPLTISSPHSMPFQRSVSIRLRAASVGRTVRRHPPLLRGRTARVPAPGSSLGTRAVPHRLGATGRVRLRTCATLAATTLRTVAAAGVPSPSSRRPRGCSDRGHSSRSRERQHHQRFRDDRLDEAGAVVCAASTTIGAIVQPGDLTPSGRTSATILRRTPASTSRRSRRPEQRPRLQCGRPARRSGRRLNDRRGGLRHRATAVTAVWTTGCVTCTTAPRPA